MRKLVSTILIYFFVIACYSPDNATSKNKKGRFIYRETLVTGKDTGMITLGSFKRVNIADVLCQHWELARMEDASSIEPVLDEKGKRILPELILFKDSSVVENPHSHFSIGTWRINQVGGMQILMLHFNGKADKNYFIRSIQSQTLILISKGIKEDSLRTRLSSDGRKHQNMYNDPFHPVNNQWRIKPPKPENDSAIKQRVKQCVKFYALYFRDNIKRQKPEISFLGLPEIFEWYKRGIGLPDRTLVEDSWMNCFYDKEQALKGYDILRKLIVDYEFDWPKGAPNWVYETHSVLEQMYRKL